MTAPPVDSLKKRYFFKLAAGFLGMAMGAVTQALIPRGLGPVAYGDFNFLHSFFTRAMSFLEMGTSIGFYTKLSQRPRERGLVLFYAGFAALICLSLTAAVLLIVPTSLKGVLWPGQEARFILMAAALCALLWVSQLLIKMADAYGLTVHSEIARILQKALGLSIVAGLFFARRLDLANFFLSQYAASLFLGAALLWIIARKGFLSGAWTGASRPGLKTYPGEFYAYSHPLLTHSVVALFTGILDRWLLQTYGGSVQQGFFGLSYQIGAICFLFPGAMEPLLTREFSIAFKDDDRAKMAALFSRHIPLLYAVAAYFSCFAALQADTLIFVMGGDRYKEALAAVTIMALFPIHQTYGQLSGAVFYATGQTKLYRNIAITAMLLGLPASYFMIAPADMWGLDAGATGLAFKMIAMNLVVVNVQLYFNARYLSLPMGRFVAHQFYSAGALLALAWGSTGLVDALLPAWGPIPNFIAAGVLYTAVTAALGWTFPAVFGLDRENLRIILAKLVKIYE